MGDPVRLELTGDEALVLFEFLFRFDDDGSLTIQDQAEERALWKLQLANGDPAAAASRARLLELSPLDRDVGASEN